MQNVLERTPLVMDRIWTYDELVAEMPEMTQPHELWAGTLIMSPTPWYFHQKISLRFYRFLHSWVTEHKLGEVIAAPIDMVFFPRTIACNRTSRSSARIVWT